MATTANFNETNALFLGLFDRVAAPSGQTYWADQLSANSTAALNSISTFVNGGISFTAGATGAGTIGAEITSIFENLLGRAPLAGGLAYWSGQYIGTGGTQTIGQITADIYNTTNAIPAGAGFYIDNETMSARVYAAGNFTQDYAANVIPSTFSYAAAGNYITTAGDLTQSSVNSNPTLPFTTYSPAGIQSDMTSLVNVPQTIPVVATQTVYTADLTSPASAITFLVNDTGSFNSANANGSPDPNTPVPSNLSPSDSLSTSGGTGTLTINAFITTAGADPALNNSSEWGLNYYGLLPSTMTGINTIEFNNQSMAVNTSTGAAAAVPNIIVSASVSDAFNNVPNTTTGNLATYTYGGTAYNVGYTDPYVITSTQNFTYENTNFGAIIDSTGTSANVTLANVTANGNILAINGVNEAQTINIMGSAMTTLNLTSAGTLANSITLTSYGPVILPFGTLTAAPLTALNISGGSANILTIADNVASLTTINASHDAGTLNLATNTSSDTITVGTGSDTITTMAIYDTYNASTLASTTPENITTISGVPTAVVSSLAYLQFDVAAGATFTSAAGAAANGFNPLNSITTNIANIVTALQTSTYDAGAVKDTAVYFQEGGNTYIVNDSNAYTGAVNIYTDQVVQLTGTPTLGAFSYTSPVVTVHL